MTAGETTGVFRCSSQEEHVLKPRVQSPRSSAPQCCSSQEEHVLKLHSGHRTHNSTRKLLLARGACIETYDDAEHPISHSCSSQEEHVLKQHDVVIPHPVKKLLLARGACIETAPASTSSAHGALLLARGACIETRCFPRSPQSQLLLLARGACIETASVLVPVFSTRCSSQEEHVLKQCLNLTGDCLQGVAPRKRSMY